MPSYPITYICTLYKQIPHSTNWSILGLAPSYSRKVRMCQLCLLEKTFIATADPRKALNKRNEIISKCRHWDKTLLKNWWFFSPHDSQTNSSRIKSRIFLNPLPMTVLIRLSRPPFHSFSQYVTFICITCWWLQKHETLCSSFKYFEFICFL